MSYISIQTPPPPSHKSLSAALALAIKSGDCNWARNVFSSAFFNKIQLVPDWHHLLLATTAQDKDMVKLLVNRGGGWSPQETRHLKELFPEQWPQYAAILRSCGQIIGEENLPPIDYDSLVGMAQNLLAEHPKTPTYDHIKQKIAANPTLQHAFNKKVTSDRLFPLYGRDLVTPGNLEALVSASQKKLYFMRPEQFLSLVIELQKKYKSGTLPLEMKMSLNLLTGSGANPRDVTDHAKQLGYYMGKKEPGLTKVLYEQGLLEPTDDLLEALRKKAGLPMLQSDQYRHEKSTAYAEFFFQVMVEKRAPEKFVPQRGAIASYHKAFQETLFTAPPAEPRRPFRSPRHGHW